MKRLFNAAAIAAGSAALIAAMTAASPPAAPSQAETYFKCLSGYQFSVSNNDAAQCKRAAYTTTSTRNLMDCPAIGGVGTFARTDFSGTRDMCVGTNPVTGQVAVERACWPTDVSAGYVKRIVSGLDRCEKSTQHPEDVRAPSVAVTR